MHAVPIPDLHYFEAQRVASANGVSLERFAAEAVHLHLADQGSGEKKINLTAEQHSIVWKGQADIKAGLGISLDEARVELAAYRAEWLQANQS